MVQKIKVCSREGHEIAPLICTFAFRGYEFWCPVCGGKARIFDSTEETIETPELIALGKAYKSRALPYLQYCSSLSGGLVEDGNGKLVPVVAEPVKYEYYKPIELEGCN